MSLSVVDVSVRLGGADVLTEVSLDVAEGEVVSVLGPSGSGKSTLLRVIAGLQAPDRGRVLLDGRDVTAVPTHRRGVGLMFQDHALFPHRDVGGNVAFGLRMAGESRAAISLRVGEVLELVGLAGFERRAVDGLSGGERQRVALARALAPRPSVLLLDEPLGSLDRALRDRLLDDLADLLAASAVTTVHVTHDQGEAFATGERIVVVRDGRIAQVGPPSELWLRPVDAEVARIVGPAGIVPVTVAEDGSVTAPWGTVDSSVDRATVEVGPALLVLRPDGIEVVDVTAGGSADGAIRGRVVSRSYRGDHVVARVVVDGAGDTPVEIPVVDRAGLLGATGEQAHLRLVAGAGVVVSR